MTPIKTTATTTYCRAEDHLPTYSTTTSSAHETTIPSTTTTTTNSGVNCVSDHDPDTSSRSSNYQAAAAAAVNDCSKEEEMEDLDAETPFQQLMNRGNFLRQLRLLALADDMERQQRNPTAAATTPATIITTDSRFYEEKKEEDEPFFDNDKHSQYYDEEVVVLEEEELTVQKDVIHTVSSTNSNVNNDNNTNETVTMLDYNSYLVHQRYYDDLKHVDINYIDYGYIIGNRSASSTAAGAVGVEGGGNYAAAAAGGRLIVEQRKRLGKGGLCWDAAFMLGEHVIHQEEKWNHYFGGGVSMTSMKKIDGPSRVVELGAGTGLCGMMVAKAVRCHVEITDLPELYDLMSANVERNFGGGRPDDDDDPTTLTTSISPDLDGNHNTSMGTISSRVLRWGIESDYQGAPYDCIIGADIVTNLYDPVALAQTIHALSGPNTRIYISGKARLDKPHEEFDAEMKRLFQSVKKTEMEGIFSRLKSPNVFIVVAEGKRSL